MTEQAYDPAERTMDELVAAAEALAAQDERLRHLLVQARKAAGMSQRDVAAVLGIKQSSVAGFESHDNDPRLSTIRRYALAVGAHVEHRVSTPATAAASGSALAPVQVVPSPVAGRAPLGPAA
jgi:DNA-binding XRE family transcriptional regulator